MRRARGYLPQHAARAPRGELVPVALLERALQERRALAEELKRAQHALLEGERKRAELEKALVAARAQRRAVGADGTGAASSHKPAHGDRAVTPSTLAHRGAEHNTSRPTRTVPREPAQPQSHAPPGCTPPSSDTTSAILHLADVYDNIERALACSKDPTSPFHTGYERLRDQVDRAITACGATRIGRPGEPFRPQVHEAVATEPAGTHAAEHITSVIQHGLRRASGELIRPARVVVAI